MSEIKAALPDHPALDSIENEKKANDDLHLESLGDVEGNRTLAELTAIDRAVAAELAEQSMTFREAIRDYRSAVFWSFAISLCIIMEGYDTALPVSDEPEVVRAVLTRRARSSVYRLSDRNTENMSTKKSATSLPLLGSLVSVKSPVSEPSCRSLPLRGSSKNTGTERSSRLVSSPCSALSLSSFSPKTLQVISR